MSRIRSLLERVNVGTVRGAVVERRATHDRVYRRQT